mgnify:CR=1 FL=1
MAKLIDPDSLAQATEVVISTGAKTIQLLVAGNLSNASPGSTSGVTMQCLYSFLKEEWKTDAALNKFKFPIKMYTKTDGTFINGWTFADATSRNLVRDAGWTEGANQYAGIVTLGNFDSTSDQGYYQRVVGYDQAITNFNKTGNVNEAILITGATGYLKNYLRIRPKIYAEYDLPSEQTITTLEPVLYKLPLANSTDLKITATDITIDTTTPYVGTATATNADGSATAASPNFTSAAAPFVAGDVGKLITIASGTNAGQYKIITYTSATEVVCDRNFEATGASITYNLRPKGMKINYLKGVGFTTYANSTVYPAASVVYDSTGRWFFTTAGGTSNAATRALDTGCTWVAYDGEVQMGSNYYAFNRIVTANGGTDRQVYDWLQRQLRVSGVGKDGGVLDINQNDSTTVAQRLGIAIRGNIAELLAEYVGDTLKTKGGLRIVGFDSNSTNSLVFRDVTVDGGGVSTITYLPVVSTERTFPFVAAGTLNFSANLVSEPDGDTKYTMYFTTNPGGNFDTSSAIIVDNNSAVDITGQITGASLNWDFDYTNNAQGGRTPDTNADVTIVAQGLNGATWVIATHTITKTTGQSITINADDERNYSNPA